MSPRTAFAITGILGALWACYGVFTPTWTEWCVGTIIAAVGAVFATDAIPPKDKGKGTANA
jgi:hypothetical protein